LSYFLCLPPPPTSTLLPYTTLFRSLIFIMTGGGPSRQSQTLPLYMYEQAFSYGQLGYGTAVALLLLLIGAAASLVYLRPLPEEEDRKSTRLNSSHVSISYAVFCLKK